MSRFPATICLFAACLLAACSSDNEPSGDELVTLPGGDNPLTGEAPGDAQAGAANAASVQAVTPEGSRLEPLMSRLMTEQGLDANVCQFSPAQGALPVIAFGRSASAAMVSIDGKLRSLEAQGTVGASGGRFSGEGVSAQILPKGSVSGSNGGPATLALNDGDGPSFTYRDGFFVCY